MSASRRAWRLVGLAVVVVLAGLAALAAASGFHLTRLVGWNEAERLVEALGLAPGTTVADIGAGDGWLAVEVARRVEPGGHVYATEIDPGRREAIRAAAARAGLDNVTVIAAKERETGLPAGCCAVVYLRRVYHHLAHPAALNASLFATVAPGGRLAIVDFEARGVLGWLGGHGDRPGHGASREDVVREVTAAGFALQRTEERWGRLGYLLVFHRPADGPPGSAPRPSPSRRRRRAPLRRPAPPGRSLLASRPAGQKLLRFSVLSTAPIRYQR